jgi:histidinol dehydrogenase
MLKEYTRETFLQKFRRRDFDDYPEELAAVRQILAAVREAGDEAVLAYTERFDQARLTALEVSAAEFAAAEAAVEPESKAILQQAAENIAAYHRRQLQQSWVEYGADGIILGQRITALDRVGAYVPGGAAAYPSSVLMTVVPARIAGVREVVMVTPPQADGSVNPYTLVAAGIAGVDAVYKCGGAQAIAALAYGTASIPRVDKIVGPGNLYVTLAKREVAGIVGIDMLAGPSEVVVVADETARADFVAADLLAQAEHDPLAAAYCVTTSARLAAELPAEVNRQCAALPRRTVIEQALRAQGALVTVENLSQALEIVNLLAPEHLELHLADPWSVMGSIRHAGAIFVGSFTPESLGDYWAGPNHVLPTAGAARFSSVLSVDDFCKRTSLLAYSPQALLKCAAAVEKLAAVEGLAAHGQAVTKRREFLAQEKAKHHPTN